MSSLLRVMVRCGPLPILNLPIFGRSFQATPVVNQNAISRNFNDVTSAQSRE